MRSIPDVVARSTAAKRSAPMIRWRNVIAAAWLVAATVVYAAWGHRFYPIQHWLFFFWARAWAGALLFGLASLAAGVRLLALLRVSTVTLAERFTLATALGVLVFALGIYLVGLLGLLGPVFFFSWPATLLLVGARPLARQLRHVRTWFRAASIRALAPRTVPQLLATLFLLAGCLGVYLQVITPANIAFDARWYHLPIAETTPPRDESARSPRDGTWAPTRTSPAGFTRGPSSHRGPSSITSAWRCTSSTSSCSPPWWAWRRSRDGCWAACACRAPRPPCSCFPGW